jgi:diguanylate cyclase
MSDFLSTDQPGIVPPRFELEPNRRAETARRRRMLRDLDIAVAQGALRLQLWPRFAVGSGALVAHEASWRWSHRRHGALPGSALMEMAGHGDIGARLGAWCLADASRAASRLGLPISIRVGAGSLPVVRLQTQLQAALSNDAIPPSLLELRFAETQLAAMSNEDILRLSALRDIGIGVALEHFGIGMSSLGLLRRVPLSAITLAADLLRHVPQDSDDRAMFNAVVTAARGMGLRTVACGVERGNQLAYLLKVGCDAAQGPLFAGDLAA